MAESDVTVFNVSADEPGGADATVKLAGGAVRCLASAVSAASQANDISVTLAGAEVSAESGSVVGFGQGTPGTLGFPRISAYVIGGVSGWAHGSDKGDFQREGLSYLDIVILGINSAIITDQDQSDGDLSRQNIIIDLKARSAAKGWDIIIFDYSDVMEKSNTDDTSDGSSGAKCYNESGPPGAELFWETHDTGSLQNNTESEDGSDVTPIGPYSSTGLPVNDWWARRGDGQKKSTFSQAVNPYNVNLCPGFVRADADGTYFSEWYWNNVIDPNNIAPHEISNGGAGIGHDGINSYCDVTDHKPRTNTIDWNGDGRADESRSVFDAFDAQHLNDIETVNYGGGVYSAAQWRLGHRNYFNIQKAKYPEMYVICNNTTWPRQYQGTGEIPYDVQPEYQLVQGTSIPLSSPTPRSSCWQGGVNENVVNRVSSTAFPSTGVMSNGLTNYDEYGLGFPGETKGWQIAFNEHRYLMEVCANPKLVSLLFSMRCNEVLPDTTNGRQCQTWIPRPGITNMYLWRWMLCTALLGNGYAAVGARPYNTDSRKGKQTCIFDETGLINHSTTGLNSYGNNGKGWLGQPLEDPVTVHFSGSGDHRLFKREFENGLSIVSTSKTNTLNVDINDIGGAGLWKRINGFQDPTWNDGSTVNASFNIAKLDGIVLIRNIVDTSIITAASTLRAVGTATSNVKCDSDGDWYESSNTGGYSTSEGEWLKSGVNSDVWVQRTINLGTLTTDPGAGRWICSTDREYGVERATQGSKSCTLTFEFFNAASGGRSLGSKQIVISAEQGLA
jgi:hypothetical protein